MKKKCIYDIYKDTSLIAFIANGHSSVVERSTKNRLTKIFVGSKTLLSAEVFQKNETFFLDDEVLLGVSKACHCLLSVVVVVVSLFNFSNFDVKQKS